VIYDVGDAILLSTVVRDVTGTPVNTPTVTALVTKPDLTTTAPTVTNTGSGGLYTAQVTVDQAGMWRYTFTASGTVVSVETGQFTAVTTGRVLVASFAEAKQRINRGDVADDNELRGYLIAATDWAESVIGGPLSVQTFTEKHWVGYTATIVPRKRPVVAITSITPDQGVALSSASYFDTGAGTIEFRYGASCNWHTLVYTAGLTIIAERLKLAGLEVFAHLWAVQNGSPARGYQTDDLVPTPLGFAVPRRAMELVEPDKIPGIA
jgi:hypothetical protein